MQKPERGEFWRVKGGSARGTVMEIIDVPDSLPPSQSPYVVIRIAGQPDNRNLALDERWGSAIERIEKPASPDDRSGINRQVAHDRIARLGMAGYGQDDPNEVILRILTDFAVWGEGKPVDGLRAQAWERADELLNPNQEVD